MCLVVDPGRQETLELGAASIDHSERGVARSREIGRGRHEALEQSLERQLGRDGHAGLEECAKAVLARPDGRHRTKRTTLCGKPTSYLRSSPDAARARREQSRSDRKEQHMFKTILWATDGSETAALALPYALGLAERDNAKLVVAHVREIFVGRAG